MKRNWREIVADIYPKVEPIGGQLFTAIGHPFVKTKKIEHIWIKLFIKGFKYEDPWDGEFGPYPEYHMSIEPNVNKIYMSISSIKDIQNYELIPDKTDQIGGFSNSLDFVVHKLKFGKIIEGMIEVDFEYSFTNSYSYGNMNGTLEDHLTEKGHLSTKLKIRELQITVPNKMEPAEIIEHLDKNIYDINNYRIGKVPEDLSWTAPHAKGYIVPYKKEYV